MDPQLTIAPGHIDVHVWGERTATYDTAATVPGFSAVNALGLRPAMQPFPPVGNCLWICHGNVNGLPYGVSGGSDGAAGRIISGEIVARRGSQSVGFRHKCTWVAPDGSRVLEDERTIRVTHGPSSGAILDLRILLKAVSDNAVTLGQTEESLLCACVAPQLLPSGGGQLRNSNDEFGCDEIHGRLASWCACNGVVAGDTVGFALLDHPDNPWYPSPWNCRGDGILSPSPFAWRAVELPPGAALDLKYRLVIHCGYVEAGWVRARLADWVRSTDK